MAPTLQSLGIDQRSIAERLCLVQEIWDSITAEIEQLPLTERQRQEVAPWPGKLWMTAASPWASRIRCR
jgi:Putative addiction module component